MRVAVGLRRQGIGPGDRVAVQLPNWTEFAVVAAALSRISAIIVPIMPIYRGDEVGYVLQHSGAVAAVTCQDFRGFDHLAMFADIAPSCPDLRLLIAARAGDDLDPAVALSLSDLAADGDLTELEAEAGPDSSPDDGFLIVYTSGTTSRPKGCYHTLNTMRSSAAAIVKSLPERSSAPGVCNRLNGTTSARTAAACPYWLVLRASKVRTRVWPSCST